MRRSDTTPDVSRTVGRGIRAVRDLRRLSAAAVVSALAGRGHHLNRSALCEIELGNRRVTVDDLVHIAAVLDVAPARFLDGTVIGDVHDFRTRAF